MSKKPLVACVSIRVHVHYERDTHRPIREFSWSAGLGLQKSPIPMACAEGQSRHGKPEGAVESARAFMDRLGVEIASLVIPKIM